MDLNQEALDDLNDKTIVDDELVHYPNSNIEKDKVTIIPSDEKTVVPEIELKKLPDMEVQFNLVEDGVSKVVSLKEVESEILGQESINQKGAEYINASFEGFLNDNFTIKQFTINPSKTNFTETKRRMSLTISKEENQVVSNFNSLIEKISSSIIKLSEKLDEKYYKDFYESLSHFVYSTRSDKEAILSKKGNYIEHEGQMVDFTQVNLLNTTVKFQNIELIKQSLESYMVKTLIAEFLKKDIAEISNEITLKDLICFFADDFSLNYIQEQMNTIRNDSEKLKNLNDKFDDNSDFTAVNDYWKENASFILSCSKNINVFCTVLNNLSFLAFAIKPNIEVAKTI